MTQRFIRICSLLGALALCACEEDDSGSSALDAGLASGSVIDAALAPDAAAPDGAAPNAAAPLYLVTTSISTTDESNLLVMLAHALTNDALDPKKALQFPGGGSAKAYGNWVFVAEAENKTITRYDLQGESLVRGPNLSFLDRGFQYFGSYFQVENEQRAYIVNDAQLQLIEWNPSAMTITASHDLRALKREGWGHEFRNAYLRPSDGKLFLQWAYTNDRKDFLNNFVLGVFDPATKSLSIYEEPSCPTTAGFGGYFDEQEDLYLIADSFGLFTKFGGFKEPKDACVLRVKKGEATLDPTFKFLPAMALGGREPWGFYYAGNGIAYTTAIDPAIIPNYDSVYEVLFAPVHAGFLLDVHKGTARELTGVPPTGVGFESHRTDGRLLVPRTTGEVRIFDIATTETTVYDIRPDGSAQAVFALPGYISTIARVH